MSTDDVESISTILSRAVNKSGNGIRSAPPAEMFKSTFEARKLSEGEQRAVQLREAGEKTARAIEEQAQQRVAIAISEVEEAKAKIERAKSIANDVRKDAEEEAQRVIDRDKRNLESSDLLEQIADKFTA